MCHDIWNTFQKNTNHCTKLSEANQGKKKITKYQSSTIESSIKPLLPTESLAVLDALSSYKKREA